MSGQVENLEPASSEEDEKKGFENSKSDDFNDHQKSPRFTEDIEDIEDSVYEQLESDMSEKTEKNFDDCEEYSRSEVRNRLVSLAKQEVNTNRQTYRSIVHQNLEEQQSNWDENISKVEKVNKIDELLDTLLEEWAYRHVDDFVDSADQSGKLNSLEDFVRYGLGVRIVYGLIEEVASDLVNEYGGSMVHDIVNWFVQNTEISKEGIFNVIEAIFRAMFGV